MKVLIKIGGTLLDSTETRARLATEIAQAVREGLQAVVVHRVTTPEVLDAVLKVFAGSVNQELVGALIASGARAVGLSGMDALLTEACRMSEELGFVGKPTQSNPQLLDLLIDNSYLPVIACVAGDRQGRFYNVNADQMAVSLACAIRAEKLLFLTDVEGVRGQDNVIYSTLGLETSRQLIDAEIATGGMRAKLEAATDAIRAGFPEAVIAPGASPGIIGKLLVGKDIGTRLVAMVGTPSNA
jgi:acetylglutamate kinase